MTPIDPTDYGEMRADVKNLCALVKSLSVNLEKHLDRCDSRHSGESHDLDAHLSVIYGRLGEHDTAIKVNAVKTSGWGAVGGLISATIGWIIFMITGGK